MNMPTTVELAHKRNALVFVQRNELLSLGIPVTICKSYELRLTNSWGFNSSCFAARLFWKNQINVMAADALAPCVTRSSTSMVLIIV